MADVSPVLVTGAAGFIGAHVSRALLSRGMRVVGVDNLNDYYDPELKHSRLADLCQSDGFLFEAVDLADPDMATRVFADASPKLVIHLAAQAGVRYSLDNPSEYIRSNIVGFFNVLEECRRLVGAGRFEHLVYASSSSVYGNKLSVPYRTTDPTDSPVSLYAATKKSNELLAYSYSNLFRLPATGLRFFTVYGPSGRPDMAYFKFAELMARGEPIQLYNYGDMRRDFTYIDDVVAGICSLLDSPPVAAASNPPHRVFNIGNHDPVTLGEFVRVLEDCLLDVGVIDQRPRKDLLPMQAGDVYETYADVDDLMAAVGFSPSTPLRIGLEKFAQWFAEYSRAKRAGSGRRGDSSPSLNCG